MPTERLNVYWDANAFIGYIAGEPDKVAACTEVVKAAMREKIMIFSSAIIHVEVLHLGRKLGKEIPPEDREKIRRFFDEPFVRVITADRWICRDAQEWFWKNPALGWKDAIHIATVMKKEIPVFHTYDPDLLQYSGSFGEPPVKICKPGLEIGPLFNPNP